MFDNNLDYDEGIILENDSVWWESRDELELDNFVLTNKRIYCEYKKGNGLFKKATKELCSFPLSDIKIVDGKALVQQVKREGSWCLLIQFRHGLEYFSFSDSPKEEIPQWITTINNTLGIPSDNNYETLKKRYKAKARAFCNWHKIYPFLHTVFSFLHILLFGLWSLYIYRSELLSLLRQKNVYKYIKAEFFPRYKVGNCRCII